VGKLRPPFLVNVLGLAGVGKRVFEMRGLIFDWANPLLGLLVDEPVVDEIFLADRTFVLKHDCYYMK
jgi:hypothetical protein